MLRAGGRALLILPVVVTHALFPTALLAGLYATPFSDRIGWAAAAFEAAGFVAFLHVAGAWSWFGQTARRALLVLLLLAAVAPRPHARHADEGRAATPLPEAIGRTAIGALFLGLAAWGVAGRRQPRAPLDLLFPLAGGTFVAGQAGSTRIVNSHARHPAQRFALDLQMLGEGGVRARGLLPRDLDRYAIFGHEVRSPCVGVVLAAVDGLPDHAPPERDPAHPAGNHVAIDCGEGVVFLAHLQDGSVAVARGDRVGAGQVLGRVGNSGNTTEPHLHIHAERAPHDGRMSTRPGLPLTFAGRSLARNDRVAVEDHPGRRPRYTSPPEETE